MPGGRSLSLWKLLLATRAVAITQGQRSVSGSAVHGSAGLAETQ